MAEDQSQFSITELPSGIGGAPGEQFAWTSDTSPPTPAGGGRAAPKQPWTMSGQQRNKRTDYPSALVPSIQVLGPVHKPFTFEGKFDDRYNFAGYAVAEKNRLEDVIRRGNLCQFQFQDQVYVGIFTDYQFHYRRAWDIGYTLTVEAMLGRGILDQTDRQPATIPTTANTLNDVALAVQSVEDFHDTAPSSVLGGTLWNTISADVSAVSVALDSVGATIDASAEQITNVFSRLATQYRELEGAAFQLLTDLAEVRADTDMTVQTAIDVLNFEDWSRSVRYAARLAFGSALVGDIAASQQASPEALRMYRPQAGESLYGIARKFYGTPFAWRIIYDRNALSSVTLTGTEVLIIPDRGSA